MSEYQRFGTFNMVLPKEGAKAYPINLDFRATGKVVIDFTLQVQQGFVSFIQSVYIDNSLNPSPLKVTCSATNHNIKIPANSQGYFPLFLTSDPVITFETQEDNNLIVPIVATNVPVTPYVWAVEGSR